MATIVMATSLTGCAVGLGLLGVATAAGSPGPYTAETLGKELGPASVRTLGCLDVGFVPFERNGRQLLDFHVGNRCPHPEAVDLGKVAIRAATESGARPKLKLFDPRSEISRVHVGASERGLERLALDGVTETLDQLCLGVEAVAPDAPEVKPAPLCFRRQASGQWQAVGGDLG